MPEVYPQRRFLERSSDTILAIVAVIVAVVVIDNVECVLSALVE